MLRPAVTARAAALRRSFPVSAALDPYVERYWAARWDRAGQPPFRSEVLSHPSVNLSLESGTAPRWGVRLPAALLHGAVGRRFVVDLVGVGRVVAVKFRPGGFTAMTGMPVPRDDVRRVEAAPWLGRGRDGVPAELLELLDLGTDEEVAAGLDAALLPAAREPEATYDQLRGLLARMVTDRSLIRVEQVAAEASLSPRTLQRLFARYVGVGPKAVLARYRLQDAMSTIDDGGVGHGVDGLAALAASLGWFDHAHFCRDFRDLVGTTPSAYQARAREEEQGPEAGAAG